MDPAGDCKTAAPNPEDNLILQCGQRTLLYCMWSEDTLILHVVRGHSYIAMWSEDTLILLAMWSEDTLMLVRACMHT